MGKEHYKGKFYFATQWSVYRMTIKSLHETPELMKMAFRGDRPPKVVPVACVVKPRFYWAITSNGVIAYRMGRNQKMPSEHALERLELQPNSAKGHQTRPPIGFFLKQDDAEECLDWCSRQNTTLGAFDEDYDTQTLAVLKLIGFEHPLISISTEDKANRKYALPARLISLMQV